MCCQSVSVQPLLHSSLLQRFHTAQIPPKVTLPVGDLHPNLMIVPWYYRSQHLKRHLNPFSRFAQFAVACPILYTMGRHLLPPSRWVGSGPPSNTCFLGPTRARVITQTASRTAQPLLHGSQTRPTHRHTDRQTDRQTDHATPCAALGRYNNYITSDTH